MPEIDPDQFIQSTCARWSRRMALARWLTTLSVTLVVAAILIRLDYRLWMLIPFLFIALLHILQRWYFRKISANDVVQFLNINIPDFEESAALLLRPISGLSLL